MQYRLRFEKRAMKDLQKMQNVDRKRVVTAIETMTTDLSGDIRKLTVHYPKYRLRVGNFRVLFDIKGDEIAIHRIKDRREAY